MSHAYRTDNKEINSTEANSTQSKRKRFTKWRIDLAIHEALAIARTRSIGNAFEPLLAVVVGRSDLLRPLPPGGQAGWIHAEQFLRGLLTLAEHHRSWLREAEGWNPDGASRFVQFDSLARHLLASHPVPNFMTPVWLEEPSPTAAWHQTLYKHLGRGNSIRGADVPIRLTKPMARHFMQAPDHLSVEEALRWAYVRGLGGDKRFAKEVLASRLGTSFGCETFWTGLLRFLIDRPKLDLALVAPIIDFLHARRGGPLTRPFRRMTERDFGSLVGSVRHWMERNPSYGRRGGLRWPATGIGGLRLIEPQAGHWSVRYWTIRELCDSRELVEEGRDLHHCVATYAGVCARRLTSIWSLRSHGSLESRRVLTIQVNPKTRRIVTALGRCNAPPKPEARRLMEMWAEREGLEIGRWV